MPPLNLLLLLLSLLIALPAAGAAQIYRYTDPDGTVWLTDKQASQHQFGQYAPFKRSPKSTARVHCLPPGSETLQQRKADYAPLIERFSEDAGLSPALIHAIISVESCYDPQARSGVGAEGLMQLMPATAGELGVTDSFDPEQNLRGGIRYMAGLVQQFNYNYRHALAAYNAGPGAVTRFGGIPPYPETRDYVDKVMTRFQQSVARGEFSTRTASAD
ncbi:lytic transglycosylase domain-containing protein [Granulosicoccaceae sp. 1_MG-2023]|nr:lytic transglycosylase domain-containing protein [Granulosicoccaceae sp. 1_MG-2023]